MKILETLLLGVIIGILIAPDKGSETRKKISGKLSGFKDDATDFVSNAVHTVKDKAGDISDKVKVAAKQATENLNAGADDAQDNLEDGLERL